MEFWYQMYGEHLGSLNVYQKIDDSETALWRETEPRGPQWNPARVQLSGTAQFIVSRPYSECEDKSVSFLEYEKKSPKTLSNEVFIGGIVHNGI